MGNRASRRARSENDVDVDKLRRFAHKLEYQKTMYLRGENQPETKELSFQYRDFLKNQGVVLVDLARTKPEWAPYADAIRGNIASLGYAQVARFYFHFSWLDLNFNYTATPNVIINQNEGPRTVVVLASPEKSGVLSPMASPKLNEAEESNHEEEDKKFVQIMGFIEKECIHADLFVHNIIKTFDNLLNARYRTELREQALRSFAGAEELIKLQDRVVKDVAIFLDFLDGLLRNLFHRLTKNPSIPQKVLSAYIRRCVERIAFDQAFRIRNLVHTCVGLVSQREETTLAEIYMAMRDVRPEDFDVDQRFLLSKEQRPYSKLIDYVREIGVEGPHSKTFSTLDELNHLFAIKGLIEEEVDRYYDQEKGSIVIVEDRTIMTSELADILCYVLVCAGNIRILTHLNMVEAFLSKKLSVSSNGTFFLYALKMAIEYLSKINPETATHISKQSLLRISLASAT